MKRPWIAAAVFLALALAAAAAWLMTAPREELPLAGLVPEDALLYAGFRSVAEAEALAGAVPREWTEPFLAKLAEQRSNVGAVAVYLDREGEWVALARLTRAAAAFSDAAGGVAVSAQSEAALRRHRERKGAIAANTDFRALRAPLFVNLEALGLPGRLGDFSGAGFEIEPGPPLVLRGRAAYRAGLLRTYLRHYVHAPPADRAGGNAPVRLAFVESAARGWQDVLRGLGEEDGAIARREEEAIRREVLGGEEPARFLGRLGPSCGLAATPVDGSIPTVTAWLDLPDPATRAPLAAILPKAGYDILWSRKQRGLDAPYGLWRDEETWRVKILRPWAERHGGALSPAWAVRGDRLVVSSRASELSSPGPVPSDAHVTASIEVAPALAMARALAPLLDDLTGEDWRGRIEGWSRRLEWLKSIDLEGRFTGQGLRLEIRLGR